MDQWILLFFVGVVVYSMYSYNSRSNVKCEELDEWFRENKLSQVKTVFTNAGYIHPEHIAFADDNSLNELFPDIPPATVTRERFDELVVQLKEQFILREWLDQNGFTNTFKKLRLQTDAKTLDQFARLGESDIYFITDSFMDYVSLRSLIAKLPTNSPTWNAHKAHLLEEFVKRHDLTVFVGEEIDSVYVSTVVAAITLLVTIYVRHKPGLARPRDRSRDRGDTWCEPTSLFDTLFGGSSLHAARSRVKWQWTEPETVGKTVTFTIEHFTRNNRAYPVSNQDSILVEVTHDNSPVTIAVDHGGEDPKMCNVSTVKFAVHRSGTYRISVMIGAQHIQGSPFSKYFKSGPIDPSKTCFVQHSSLVVCTVGVASSLYIEPRDEYGNICTYDQDKQPPCHYEVKVTECGTYTPYIPSVLFKYELNCKRFVMHLTMGCLGCYRVEVSINGQRIKNGDFDAVVLTESEAASVKKNATKSHTAWYEARQITMEVYDRRDSNLKGKKVFCYLSPRQMTVKEFYFKIIPKRMYSFRVCPSTKFIFNGHNNVLDLPSFTMDDGCQAPQEFVSKDTRMIAAAYNDFLLRNIGGSETFRDKQEFFYQEIRQFHSKRAHDRQAITVNRHALLDSVMKATKHFNVADWCRNFEISFAGEAGLDWGGLRREFFEVVCTDLFDPSASGLFHRFKADSQCLVHPNPNRRAFLKNKHYEFAGRVVGKCLYESALGGTYRQCVKARFTRSFLAQVIGLRVNFRHFEQDDPELFVTKIKYVLENDVEEMEMVFAEEVYDTTGQLSQLVDLVPNGARIRVTNGNKLRYLDALAQYRLANSVKDEIESFLKGLNDIVPDNLLSIFDENELELLMCGTGTYSITDFKFNHTAIGSSHSFRKVLDWFWIVVSGLTQEEMARLIQFITGCSQLPPGGFSELSPKIQISSCPTYGLLPTAHTCFNQLCLPDYDSMEKFHQSLLIAINEGNQGFGLV